MAAAARWRAPLVFEVRDLWPEAPIQMGALRNPLLRRSARAARAPRAAPRHSGDRAVARDRARRGGGRRAGRAGGPRAQRRGPRSVPRGTGAGAISSSATSGPWARPTTSTAVVEAARLLDGVEFVLMGDGKHRARLERSAPANVTFSGTAAGGKAEVAELAARSSACLTVFKDVPVLATNSPNKLFDTFAAGRPAIVNMDGWMRSLVEDNDAGLYVRAGDARDLADKIAWLRDHRRGRRANGRERAGAGRARVRPRPARGSRARPCWRRRRTAERDRALLLRRQHERARGSAGLPGRRSRRTHPRRSRPRGARARQRLGRRLGRGGARSLPRGSPARARPAPRQGGERLAAAARIAGPLLSAAQRGLRAARGGGAGAARRARTTSARRGRRRAAAH